MRKFIVESQDPVMGERASSGGIRDDGGRLVSQYTNPVPYREPISCPEPEASKRQKKKSWFGNLMLSVGKAAVEDTIEMAWDDFGKPFVHEKIAQAEDWALNAWKSRKNTRPEPRYNKEAAVVQPVTNKTESAQDEKPASNVIPFPSSRVG